MIEGILISSDLSKLRRDLLKAEDEDSLFRKQKQLAELVVDDNGRKFIAYFKSRCKTRDFEGKHPPPPRFLVMVP